MWGDQPMPLVVAVDPGPAVGTRVATVRSEATGPAMRASWMHSATDSVVISLLRVGLTGRIALGPDAGGRAGAATSGAITSSLEEASAKRADAASDVRAKAVGSPPAAASAGSVRVTMRPIPCPTR